MKSIKRISISILILLGLFAGHLFGYPETKSSVSPSESIQISQSSHFDAHHFAFSAESNPSKLLCENEIEDDKKENFSDVFNPATKPFHLLSRYAFDCISSRFYKKQAFHILYCVYRI